MPDAVLDPAVVDLDRVASWMDERGLGAGPITDTELIAGGTQNVLLRFRRGEREFVLRRQTRRDGFGGEELVRRAFVGSQQRALSDRMAELAGEEHQRGFTVFIHR